MERKPAWRRYLRLFGADPAGDFDDELQFHLETKTEELIAAGRPPQEARTEALRQFGPIRPIRRECLRISQRRQLQSSRAQYFAGWLRDLGNALRSLCRTRASSIAAILILAVGIGANAAVFTLLDRLLLAPLQVPHPSELVLLSTPDRHDTFTEQDFRNLRESKQAFAGLAAEANLVVRESRGREKLVRPAVGSAVSDNYFQVLELNAIVGHLLAPSDNARVAVVSYRFWSARFNRSNDVLGRTIDLNDMPFKIIGVLPRGFFGLHRGSDCDVYVPISSLPANAASIYADGRWLRLFGRLQRGKAWPGATDLSAGTPGTWGEQRRSLWLLAAIVAVLLLMGCVNVACLLLARGAARQEEFAIRLALGGKWSRVLRQWLLEVFLLAFAGGLAGIALAGPAEHLLLAAFQWQDRPIDLSLNRRVVEFGMGLVLVTGILFGTAPALQLWKHGRLGPARERSLNPRFGSGKMLVAVEVALSLVLVACASVFIRSFQNLRAVPAGFSTSHVSFVELGNTIEPDSLKAPYQEGSLLAESLRGAPGVEAVALSDMLTFDEGWIGFDVTIPGDSAPSTRLVHLLRVDGEYFGALRISLHRGRTFTPQDDFGAPKVAILTEGTARRLFRTENPVGKRIRINTSQPEDEPEIVGVVNDIKFGSVTAPAPDVVFQPLLQGQKNGATTSSLKLQVRSGMRLAEVAALVRSRIREMRLPVSVDGAAPLEDAIAHSMLNDRIRMEASGVFGALALLLITGGIYGLMTYLVAMRTREIGIRMAMGSRHSAIAAMVLRQALRLTLAGIILGLPAALAMMNAISKLVFGLAPIDWTSLAAAALILCVTGILASVAPAWRAAHQDPVEALRVQ